MNKVFVFFVLGVFLVGLIGVGDVSGSPLKSNIVSEEVMNNFKNGAEKVKVVIKVEDANDNLLIKSSSSQAGNPKYIVDEISFDELEALSSNSSVKKIFPETLLHAFLQESTGIIESNFTNNLKINNINLTGSEQTVCIIDTGINFLHSDILGKNKSCVVDCFDKACVENCSIGDDHGHGTHVAGIVAASGGITGVAPNVSLIGIKILDSSGYGSGNSNDLSNAIDWCVDNNATVITMSLGTDNLYDSSCDGVGGLSGWKNSINSAVSQNISVIAASGNAANYTHISAPACLSNAIAVGDTYDGDVGSKAWLGTCTDSSTSLDKIVCHANRNSLVKLFAPGAMINSTWNDGAYDEAGGTSMATPMVAGAFALINQYLDSTGQYKTPGEIEDILNDTGKVLDDTANSGNYYSRINVYDALLSIDATSPEVTLVSPIDNYVTMNINQTFTCNATDWQLSNATFKLWNSSGALINNQTENLTGTENETSFNVTNLSEGEYEWNCFVSDEQGNVDSASLNFTFTIGGIEVYLNSPENGSATNIEETSFNCTSRTASEYELTNITFRLWNSSGYLVSNETRDISGTENITIFDYNFSVEDDYEWECVAYNNNSDEGDGINYSITYDISPPNITNLDADSSTTSATITWTTNESANSSISVSGGSWSNSSNLATSHSISVSGLSASTPYTYTIWSCDEATNCGNDSGSFTTNAVRTSSGGGGGGPSVKVISVKNEELWEGAAEVLAKGDRVNFNLVSGSHSLEVEEVGEGYAKVVINSEPVRLTLNVGDEVKLNMSSPYYYDLIVKLSNIVNGKANVSVTRIFEEIPLDMDNQTGQVDEDIVYHIMDEEPEEQEEIASGVDWNSIIAVGVGVVAVILIILILYEERRIWRAKKKKKEIKRLGPSKKSDGKKTS